MNEVVEAEVPSEDGEVMDKERSLAIVAGTPSETSFAIPLGGASMGASADRVHLLKAATAATLIAAMPTSTITSATDITTLAAAQTAAALAVADVASSVLATSTSASSTFTTTALGAALAAAQPARPRSSPPPPSRRCHPRHQARLLALRSTVLDAARPPGEKFLVPNYGLGRSKPAGACAQRAPVRRPQWP